MGQSCTAGPPRCPQGPPPAGLCEPGLTKYAKIDGDRTRPGQEGKFFRLCNHSSSCRRGPRPSPPLPSGVGCLGLCATLHPAELGLVLDSAMSRHGTGEPGILVILIFLGCKYSVCSFPNAQEEYLLIAKPFSIMFY